MQRQTSSDWKFSCGHVTNWRLCRLLARLQPVQKKFCSVGISSAMDDDTLGGNLLVIKGTFWLLRGSLAWWIMMIFSEFCCAVCIHGHDELMEYVGTFHPRSIRIYPSKKKQPSPNSMDWQGEVLHVPFPTAVACHNRACNAKRFTSACRFSGVVLRILTGYIFLGERQCDGIGNWSSPNGSNYILHSGTLHGLH